LVKKGLLDRKINGAVPAKETFDTTKFEHSDKITSRPKSSKKDFANQKVSIKINTDIKSDIDTIKMMEKIKFDYETIQLLVDSYKSSLSSEDRRRYSTLKDTIS